MPIPTPPLPKSSTEDRADRPRWPLAVVAVGVVAAVVLGLVVVFGAI